MDCFIICIVNFFFLMKVFIEKNIIFQIQRTNEIMIITYLFI